MKRAIEALRVHIRFCGAGCCREGLRITQLCPTGVALADDVARAFDRARRAKMGELPVEETVN